MEHAHLRQFVKSLLLLWVAACNSTCGSAIPGTPYTIPNGAPRIGFDDLRYSQTLHRVLVPGGRAGVLALIDPTTGDISTVDGLSSSSSHEGGHNFGVTSVDEGGGFLFATDRTSTSVDVIDPESKTIVATLKLSAGPDYVRYVESTHELWITQPGTDQLEIVSMSDATPPALAHVANLQVDNGPESLVIDTARGRAYTHRWTDSTLAIDVKSRQVIAEWKNGCSASRGIALEPEHGFVFAACSEGTLSVLDAANDGKILSSVEEGSGYDVIGYNARLRHVYLAGGGCSCLTAVGVSNTGKLTVLGKTTAPQDTHCVVADDIGNAWVCEPSNGRVHKVPDPYPATQ